MPARVASAAETAACERATIDAGTTSAELMRRAGIAAASVIASRFEIEAASGVAVFTGSGNNGGDGWIVAGSLAQRGFPVSVIQVAEPRSPEARAARDDAMQGTSMLVANEPGEARVIVDALLGTGSSGAPRGDIASAIAAIERTRSRGSVVAAIDLPTGLDATTGANDGCVRADATVSFGTVKRGHLIAREVCGELSVVDIGLLENPDLTSLPLLVDGSWVHARIPRIPPDAHKGTRKSLAIVGGGKGMAGAVILAGEGALRSSIGLLRIVAAPESILAVHAGIPAAIVHSWPMDPSSLAALISKADAIAIGPGLGRSSATRDLIERILLASNCPAVLDADALNDFAGDTRALGKLLAGRNSILTPHPAEMARLLQLSVADVLANRFEIGLDLARETGAAVLLKGTPTVVFSPTGSRYVSASGTAALATGGSGDVLTGIAGTLLAQMESGEENSAVAAVSAAFIHGRAAELCGMVRGVTLDDILHALPAAWNEAPVQLHPAEIAHLESRS
jgi:ADP-dependent NAD(P)H-hydrate dehydratase / NAD(P)H-hydrate epimerase